MYKLSNLLEQMRPGGKREHDALLVLKNEVTGEERHIWGRNIVTTAGNVWYAQKSCGQAPTNDFDSLYLGTAGPTPPVVTNVFNDMTETANDSEKHATATYPQTPDADADNTGDGATVVSWKFEYTTANGPFTAVQWSCISSTGAAGAVPILNMYKWAAAWDKDASTSAKVFANHTMLGN